MSERPIITCRELIEDLHLYLSGELTAERKEDFERHLARCEACVAYGEQYRITVRMATTAVAAEPEGAMPEDLVRSVVLEFRRST
jgi:anti-sigma factor RsiW